MKEDLLNISKVESFFDKLLKNKLSKNIFYENLPTAMNTKWDEMVLVDVGSGIEDFIAYGSGYINIFLYTKSLSSGLKNVKSMNALEMKLNELISESNDPNYRLRKLRVYSDYDERRNLHCNIYSVNLLIV